MADPMALLVAVAAAQAVEHVGLPEAQLNLAQAVVHLATAPKSNRVGARHLERPQRRRDGRLGEVPHAPAGQPLRGRRQDRPRQRTTSTRTTTPRAGCPAPPARRAGRPPLLRAAASTASRPRSPAARPTSPARGTGDGDGPSAPGDDAAPTDRERARAVRRPDDDVGGGLDGASLYGRRVSAGSWPSCSGRCLCALGFAAWCVVWCGCSTPCGRCRATVDDLPAETPTAPGADLRAVRRRGSGRPRTLRRRAGLGRGDLVQRARRLQGGPGRAEHAGDQDRRAGHRAHRGPPAGCGA